jgi:hypothetical protein
MSIELKTITVGELHDFIASDEFSRTEFEPISRYRAISYTMNPRADNEDTALILAYSDQRLIGYLGMFTDQVIQKDQKIKFCWFSCMWVLSEYRRSGVAIKLLKEGYNRFNGNVMITNYIPRSKAAFLKTGHYKELEVLDGFRFYIKSDLKNILTRKYSAAKIISPLLFFVDTVSNLILTLAYSILFRKKEKNYSFNFIDRIDLEHAQFINDIAKDSLFQRSSHELEWMKDYPWISDKKEKSIDYSKYYFSQYYPDFKQWFISIRNKNLQLTGFIILTRYKGELKTPYVYLKDNPGADLGIFLSTFAKKNKIRTIITYNELITETLIQQKFFLNKRRSTYGFLATKQLYELFKPLNKKVYDGDGDGAFT